MGDNWTNRDLPVLEAIVAIFDETGNPVEPRDIEARTGMDRATVQTALRALAYEDPPLLSQIVDGGNRGIDLVGPPTGHARRRVGSWPSAEALADRLIASINEAADREEDEEKKGWLKKTAGYLGSAGRDLAVGIGVAMLTRPMGGAT